MKEKRIKNELRRRQKEREEKKIECKIPRFKLKINK
jgi:hypothetical protein